MVDVLIGGFVRIGKEISYNDGERELGFGMERR
jgi:hypothetical protein